jgi:hypothetical protein
MPEPPAEAWREQAQSDWKAAGRLLLVEDKSTYCQALSKYQQTVEKSIKMVLAALRDQGRTRYNTGRDHNVEQHMRAILDAFKHQPVPQRHRLPVDGFHGILTQRKNQINDLCSLAPKWPKKKGDLFARNTEYPYQDQEDPTIWRAPAEPRSFTRKELGDYRYLAERILTAAEKAVSAIKRSPQAAKVGPPS